MTKTRKDYNREYRIKNPDYYKNYAKARHKKDPDWQKNGEKKKRMLLKNPNYIRDYTLLHRYGITLEQYNSMFIRQEGKCIICNRHQSEFKRAFHVDHCHATGEKRGLLCVNCNAMLGHSLDNIETLKNAIKYLLN